MRIEYLYQEGVMAFEKEPLKVRLDGVVRGEIRKVENGYQYFPKGQKEGGEIFKTINEVCESLKD